MDAVGASGNGGRCGGMVFDDRMSLIVEDFKRDGEGGAE